MPSKVAKIGTFSDWIGLFNDWRKEIGVNTDDIDAFHFDTLYGAIDTSNSVITKAAASGKTCARFPRSRCATP
jgi:hypothetical protein